MKLFVAINEASGADQKDIQKSVLEKMRSANHEVVLFEIPHGKKLSETCLPLVQQALSEQGIVVAAGGDGTVNGIAQLCYDNKVPLGILPLGTFNYFAKVLNISTRLDEAIEVFSTGELRPVSAGFVNEHIFLNYAGLGLYPTIIRKREEATAKYGRKRIIGALSALHSIFHHQKSFSIQLNASETVVSHRTTLVLIGNNSMQIDSLGLNIGDCTRQNKLAVALLKPQTRGQTARVLWRGITKNLHIESKLVQLCTTDFHVETSKANLDVVVDGEIIKCKAPLAFRVEPRGLQVMAPKVTDAAL